MRKITFFVSICSFALLSCAAQADGIFDVIDSLNTSGGTKSYTSTSSNINMYDSTHSTGYTLQKGTLSINQTNYAQYKILGSLGLVGTSSVKPTLNVTGVGNTYGGSYEDNGWSLSNTHGWTNLQSGASSAKTAAIVASNAAVNVTRSYFVGSNNIDTTHFGGAMFLGTGTTSSVSDSFFYKNNAYQGGAISLSGGTISLIDYVDFYENTAQKHGGALDIEGNVTKMTDAFFMNNEAPQGGAIYVDPNYKIGTLSNSYIYDNKGQQGAGIYLSKNASITSLESSEIDGNIASVNGTGTGAGSAVFLESGAKLTSSGTKFNNNKITGTGALGGTIYNEGTWTSTGGDTISSNQIVGHGGALYNKGTATLTGATITSNKTTSGSGGAIYNTGTTTLKNTTISGNTASQYGGAIYNNGGKVTLTGTTKLSNNTATVGQNLYNTSTGTIVVSDVQDTLDIDYYNQLTGKYGTYTKNTMFDQAQDIYNAGNMYINNSKLQLHNGINSNSSLTASGKKVGTVTVTNSTIDLGGKGSDDNRTGVLSANTVNLNTGSTIKSHVGKGAASKTATDANDYGKISANKISVTSSNTTLNLLVDFASKLGTNESRVYHVLDGTTVSGEFNSYDNNSVYKIEALGNGYYQISNCTAGKVANGTGTCVCPANYTDKNGTCYPNCTGTNMVMGSDGSCSCPSGYTEKNGNCYVNCTGNKVMQSDGSCKCAANYTEKNGTCYKNCPNNYVMQSNGSCQCPAGMTDPNNNPTSGQCYTNCTGGKVMSSNGSCSCPSGYTEKSGTCYQNCPNNYVMQSNGSCQCPAGMTDPNNNPTSGQCYTNCTGGKVMSSNGSCSCPNGQKDPGNGQCYPECTGGKVMQSNGNCLCPSGQKDPGTGQCHPECQGDKVMQSDGSCQCPAGQEDIGSNKCDGPCQGGKERNELGYCACPSGQEDVNGICKDNCRADQIRNSAGVCVCPIGQTEMNGACYQNCTGGKIMQSDGSCQCPDGQEDVAGVCQGECRADQIRNGSGVCVCPDGKTEMNGVCYTDCTGGKEMQSDGSCQCVSGQEEMNGMCYNSCSGGKVLQPDGTCSCDTGYQEANGVCYPACTNGKEMMNDGTCTCAGTKEEWNGKCVDPCTGGKIHNEQGMCECPRGTEDVGGVCKLKNDKKDICPNCDPNERSTAKGWLDGPEMPEDHEEARAVQEELFEAAQDGERNMEYREALDGLAPDVSPLVQTHITEITRRLSAIVSERFYDSMDHTGYTHRGKRFYRFPRRESNLWVQGMYGKSKYNVRKGWDLDTTGIALGLDGNINDAVRMGVSYAYTNAEGDSVGRETEIDSHTAMLYGEYNPNRFYTNWMALYTRSEFDETKRVFAHRIKAKYDVDALAAQVMVGEKLGPYVLKDWASGVIKPEIGARYVYTKQHAYTDSLDQKVSSADGHTLTGILGAQYTISYALTPNISWYPELRAALTYDIIEPNTKMRVNLANGSTYEVKTENMDRFGIEVGARVGVDINRTAEFSLEYEGLFKGDYTNHTGLANLKYKF